MDPIRRVITLSPNMKVRLSAEKTIQFYVRICKHQIHPEIYSLPASTFQMIMLTDALNPASLIYDRKNKLICSLIYPKKIDYVTMDHGSVKLGDKHLIARFICGNKFIRKGDVVFTPEMWSELEDWIKPFKLELEIDNTNFKVKISDWTKKAETVD